MKHKSWLIHWVFATLVVFVAGQVVAGEVKTEEKTHKVKAAGKTHLGYSMSEIMPLSTYDYLIVSEDKTS